MTFCVGMGYGYGAHLRFGPMRVVNRWDSVPRCGNVGAEDCAFGTGFLSERLVVCGEVVMGNEARAPWVAKVVQCQQACEGREGRRCFCW